MHCLNPIRIKNQSRFIDTNNRDRLWLLVRCGKCANCQQIKHAEYEFRAYKQFEDCVNKGGFVLFDSLTYSNKYLPRMRQYDEFKSLPSYRDYMCFDSSHITLFNKRLRKRLSKLGFDKDVYSYFLTSEYGLDDRFTHRPHYHVLFYVYKPIDPLLFSRLVADAWHYGRTDGLPWKPAAYVKNNVFRSLAVGSRRVCKYVSKYVMKDNAYERQINKRIQCVLYNLAGGDCDKVQSDEFKCLRQQLKRKVCQFHRQSLGFGVSALDGESAYDIINRGYFLMPNGKPTLYNKIPICNYYFRKLCYELKVLDDGYKAWSIRPDCVDLIMLRDNKIRERAVDCMRNRFDTEKFHPNIDIVHFTDYILNFQGRHIADKYDVRTLEDKCFHANRYCYASIADKNHFNIRFVNDEYLGYKDNYISFWGSSVPQKDYCEMFSYNENSLPEFNGYDKILDLLQQSEYAASPSRQSAYDVKMRVNKIAKMLF